MFIMSKHRRIFSVTSSLQYRFLASTITYGFIIVAFIIIAVMGPDISDMRNASLSPELRSSAAHRILEKNTWMWPATIAMIGLLGLHSFFKFQRVMGPLYRFQCTFRQIEKGQLLPAVTTRKKDYLKEELVTLNDMLGALDRHIRAIKLESEAVLKSFVELERSLNSGGDLKSDQLELLKTHRQDIEMLANTIGFFQLQDETPSGSEIEQTTPTHHFEAAKDCKNGISQPADG